MNDKELCNKRIDDVIKRCLEVAEAQEVVIKSRKIYVEVKGLTPLDECRKIAAEHRQLAEWLTELKELRNSLGTVKLSNMKEARELIRDYKAENITQKKLIAEYKRLLKAAVQDIRHCMRYYDPCEVCSLLGEDGECPTTDDDDCKEKYKWCYEDEALALIGEEGENDA
jgi:hypothetical protein